MFEYLLDFCHSIYPKLIGYGGGQGNEASGKVILSPSSEHAAKRVICKTEVNNENQKIKYTSVRNKYTVQFKEQALERAERDGISIKVEAVHGERFSTRADAKYQVFEYIEVYYNRIRLHSKLGYVSPEVLKLKKSLSRMSVKSRQDQNGELIWQRAH
jgi:transposase InsO family protein